MEAPPAHPPRSGFTLVEILIVVVIVGILSSLVVPRFANVSDEAKMGAFIANLKTYADACEYFVVKEGAYPPDGGSGVIPAGFGSYVDQSEYESPTPIGGVWDIEYNEMGVTSAVGVHFFGEPVPGYMLQIDEKFDDGDLADGLFREIAGDRFYYIVAE